ncbi:MAG: hypothetical protein AAB634_03525 [Patescibacteria group bacterium]
MSSSYLTTSLVFFALWAIIFLTRKDLQKPLLVGGGMYIMLVVPVTFALVFLSELGMGFSWNRITSYWAPHGTLFNLAEKTGMMGLEDIFFMFVAGGLAATAYEAFSPHRIRNAEKRHHSFSLAVFFASYIASGLFFSWHPLWNLIFASILGWLTILIQRLDLFWASIAGAFAFLTIYVGGIAMYHMAFGEIAWNLKNLTAVAYPFPVKELLYAFSLGLMWTPLYEYMTGKSIQ